MTDRTLGAAASPRQTPTVAERMWPVIPTGVAVFSITALCKYHFRAVDAPETLTPLESLYTHIYRVIGFAPSLAFFVLVGVWCVIWYVTGRFERPLARLLRIGAVVVLLGILVNLGFGGVQPALNKGELGAWLAGMLANTIGPIPALVLVSPITLFALLLATDFMFSDFFEQRRRPSAFDHEAGVEDGVTDHLRQLEARPTPSGGEPISLRPAGIDHEPTRSSDSSASFAAAVAAAAAAAEAADGDDGRAEDGGRDIGSRDTDSGAFDSRAFDSGASTAIGGHDAVADAPASTEEPRLSYFERRRRREAERWREPVDEGWVPPAPESQEIDNPEVTADANASAARDAERGSSPAPGVEEIEVEAIDFDADETAADEEVADRDGDDEAAAGDDVAEIPRPSHETAAGSFAMPAMSPWATRDLADERRDGFDAPDRDARDRDAGNFAEQPFGAGLDELADEREAAAAQSEAAHPAAASHTRAEPTSDERAATPPWSDDDAAPRDTEAAAETPAPTSGFTPAEPVVAIPRPDTPPAEPVRQKQQGLFGGGLDEALVQEAIDLVTGARRATAALLQRKLRIDYPTAVELLAELAARGVVALEGDATQARVLQ